MIITSDIHIGIYQGSSIFHKTTIQLFNKMIDFCVKNDEDKIAILGDIFHSWISVTQKDLQLMQAFLIEAEKREIEIILLRGNHDTYFKRGSPYPNWITNFRKHKNVIPVEDSPYFFKDYCFVPWDFPLEDFDFSGVLLGHFEINTFQMNDSFECYGSKYSPNDFSKFERVYSGHFHNPSQKKNITYFGAPFQQRFGEFDGPRGFYQIKNDNSLRLIEFDSPKYVKINVNAFEENKDKIKNNFVRLVFNEDYGIVKNNKIIEEAEVLGPLSLSVDASQKSAEEISSIKDEELETSNIAILFDYMEKQGIPEYLDKGLLERVVHSLLGEE